MNDFAGHYLEQGRFPGSIYFVSPQIQEDTRSLRAKGYVENRDGLLRPGGFVEVEITGAGDHDLWARPVDTED